MSPINRKMSVVYNTLFLTIFTTILCILHQRCSAWIISSPPQYSTLLARQHYTSLIPSPPRSSLTTTTSSRRNSRPLVGDTDGTSLADIPPSPLPSPSSSSTTTTTTSTLDAVDALSSLAQTILALLAGDETSARTLCGSAAKKRELVQTTFRTYDRCGSGTLSVDEAQELCIDLSRSIVTEIANSEAAAATTEVARSHARRVLDADENGTHTIKRVASKLLLLASSDQNGKISLTELAGMFDTVQNAQTPGRVDTFPQPLRALAGSLQLLPPIEGATVTEAAGKALNWHIGVPGDDHTLRRVELERGLSLVGMGRSADASTYFLPELGIVLDAGFHVKSLEPKTVLLTHGHRDHIAALPAHASKAKILAPRKIASLVERFLMAEAQLNYGDECQTDEETVAALGKFDILPVSDGDELLLDRSSYTGSPQPLGVQVFAAPHKAGVPAVSYGLFRAKTRLKTEYASLPKSELGALIQKDIPITESYNQGLLFYTGDTTIDLLRDRYEDILPKYKHIIHEVTFLGQPSAELDEATKRKGHTHYAQLHPWICAFPETTFVCVHWSLRYSREEVLEFFEQQYGGVPKNVVLWI